MFYYDQIKLYMFLFTQAYSFIFIGSLWAEVNVDGVIRFSWNYLTLYFRVRRATDINNSWKLQRRLNPSL